LVRHDKADQRQPNHRTESVLNTTESLVYHVLRGRGLQQQQRSRSREPAAAPSTAERAGGGGEHGQIPRWDEMFADRSPGQQQNSGFHKRKSLSYPLPWTLPVEPPPPRRKPGLVEKGKKKPDQSPRAAAQQGNGIRTQEPRRATLDQHQDGSVVRCFVHHRKQGQRDPLVSNRAGPLVLLQ